MHRTPSLQRAQGLSFAFLSFCPFHYPASFFSLWSRNDVNLRKNVAPFPPRATFFSASGLFIFYFPLGLMYSFIVFAIVRE
jgi:hypothetical protein